MAMNMKMPSLGIGTGDFEKSYIRSLRFLRILLCLLLILFYYIDIPIRKNILPLYLFRARLVVLMLRVLLSAE